MPAAMETKAVLLILVEGAWAISFSAERMTLGLVPCIWCGMVWCGVNVMIGSEGDEDRDRYAGYMNGGQDDELGYIASR
jgi:hypothetical protein